MAASDTLSQLATRAKIAEDRIAAAQTEARAQLQAHVAVARKTADREVKSPKRKAASAERDAVAAVVFAEAALEEAEYAVLDSALARMDAEAAEGQR